MAWHLHELHRNFWNRERWGRGGSGREGHGWGSGEKPGGQQQRPRTSECGQISFGEFSLGPVACAGSSVTPQNTVAADS